MLISFFLPNPNWVGLTVVNFRAIKNAVQLQENVVQNYIAFGLKPEYLVQHPFLKF